MRVFYHTLFLIIFAFSCQGLAQSTADHADKLSFSDVPDWVVPVEVRQANAAIETRNVDYLLFDHQANITDSQKRNFFKTSHRVNNQQGLTEAAKLEIGFSPAYEKLVIHQLYVVRDGKSLPRLNKNNIKLFQQEDALEMGIYQEGWQALIILDDVRVGDTIVYSYSINGSNPVLGDKFFGKSLISWGVPLDKYHFRLTAPAAKYLQYRLENTDVAVVDVVKDNLRTVELQLTNLAPVQMEDRYPSWFNPYSTIEYSQYKSWQEVNEWAMTLYDQHDQHGQLPQELIDLLAQQQFTNKLQAITFITQWIQDNVRYFGIETGVNSHRPSLPEETLARRYGDCKDKTVLLISALKHLKIAAAPALVSTITTQSLNHYLPSPGVFNHVITYFEFDGQAHWVDATMNGQKGPFTENSFPDLKWGFVVRPGTTALSEMTAVNAKQTEAKVNIEEVYSLGKQGEASVFTLKTRYGGWKAGQMRSYLTTTGITVATQDYLNYYARYFGEIEAVSPIKFADTADNQLLVEAKYRVKNMKQASTARNEVTLYASAIIDEVRLPQVRQRNFPYALSKDLEISHRLTIIPADMSDVIWRGDSKPVSVNTPWFDFSQSVSKTDSEIEIEYHYRSLKETVPAAEFTKYLDQIDQMDPSLGFSLWLHKEQDQRSRDRKKNVRDLLQSLLKKS